MKLYFTKQAKIFLSNTLIKSHRLTSLYLWICLLILHILISLSIIAYNYKAIQAKEWWAILIDVCTILFAFIAHAIHYKLGAKYNSNEFIGIIIVCEQYAYGIANVFLIERTNASIQHYYSVIAIMSAITYGDTIPVMVRALIYHTLTFILTFHGMGQFEKESNKVQLFKNVFTTYLTGVLVIYCVMANRYYQVMNFIGATENFKFCTKVLNLLNIGISIERQDKIHYRNKLYESINAQNNKEKVIEVAKHSVYIRGLVYLVIIVKDNTEITKHMKNQYFQMLIATITHELRTPLNIISSILNFAIEHSTDQSIKEEAHKGLYAASMQETLINDILDLAKISHGELTLNNQTVNIVECSTKIYELYRRKIESPQVAFKLSLDPKIPHFIYIDERRYKQILLNLLSNSAKFTSQGSIEIGITFTNSMLYSSVIDTGVGISEDNKDKIFQEFGMIECTSSMNKSGTGLGLSLCKKLALKMGGEITFKSIPNVKTEFQFSIQAPIVENPVTEPKHNYSLVIIVDDNAMNIAVLESYCKKASIASLAFKSGEAAIKMLVGKHNYIGLIDLHMPVMDGYEVAKALHAQNNNIKLIAVTGDDRDAVINKCLACGFEGVIEKPISFESFARVI